MHRSKFPPWRVLVLPLLAMASAAMAAPDARERGFIGKGTPEGEVLLRIGKPDHETLIANTKGQPEQKTWTYFPHARDPQTLTIFTLKAGVVTEIDRRIAR